MKHVYWLREDKIAGRTGPNTHMWDLHELKANGIAAILSVNHGEAVHETMLTGLGIAYANIPMSSNAPAREGDREFCLENLPKAMAFIWEHMRNGPVLVHCRSGKDRTGMVFAAWLIDFEGYDAKQAMDEVLSVRPIAFTAEGWMEFTLGVLDRYKARL
jgi:hypothetical protein